MKKRVLIALGASAAICALVFAALTVVALISSESHIRQTAFHWFLRALALGAISWIALHKAKRCSLERISIRHY